MAFRPVKTVVSLEGDDVLQLQEILMDEDREAALTFLREVVGEKVRCAQAETHRTEFEGGSGKEGVHFLQKGEGHAQ
jgi:hypothetical protein